MAAAFLLCALLASAPVPADAKAAPMPERWLLKFALKEMPDLPDAVAKTTWFHSLESRSARLSWAEWVAFDPKAGKATITRLASGDDYKPIRTARVVPLAMHGRLVEYDGRLYTAAVGRWAHEQPTPTDVLDLGAAVELPDNVWYQAASLAKRDGTTWVQEWRLEFAVDPRAAKEGKVKVFGLGREVTKTKGEEFVAELSFKRTKEPHESVWSIKVLAAEGMKLPKSDLPVLAYDPDRGRTFIYDYVVLNQMFPVLAEAREPAPQLSVQAGAVKLMQPPKK